MNTLTQIRLEKAAADCGFDLLPQHIESGLCLGSAKFPETINVTWVLDETFKITCSEPLIIPGVSVEGALKIQGWPELYKVLEIASNIANALPNRVAQKFSRATANLPKSTEVERQVVQRVGQQLFREALLAFWQGRCCITGLAIPKLLRASHIRPWAFCETDEERLDVFNGLLLAPHLDAIFDSGLMSVLSNGSLTFSSQISDPALAQLGLNRNLMIPGLHLAHQDYLEFHRSQIFQP